MCVLESAFFDEPEEDVDRLSLAARLEREEQSLSDESADEDSKGRPPFVLLQLNILLLLSVQIFYSDFPTVLCRPQQVAAHRDFKCTNLNIMNTINVHYFMDLLSLHVYE